MSVNPGRYRQRINFEQKYRFQNPETGAIDYVWRPAELDNILLTNVPAEVLTGPGREFIASQAEQSQTTARINLRWFEGLKSDWRIVWDGKRYNIRSIETDSTARKEYRLRCEDGVNDG